MRALTDFLIAFHVISALCGRGPALFGLLVAISIPLGIVTLLIGHTYPGGLVAFVWRAARTIVAGLH